MSYTSINFLAFVAITAILYFTLPFKRYRWIVLLVASYVFYMFAGYTYAVFIIFTTISTYLISLWIEKVSRDSKKLLSNNSTLWDKEQKKKYKKRIKTRKRLILALVLVLNFGILAFLKYFNFFAGSLNDIMGAFGISFSIPTLSLFLPLGISFYTFQSMGYAVDVYREKFPAERNFAKFALFVSFFPQIVQGPISFYDQLAHQLYEPHKVDFTRIKYGCELILWGFFKKLVIADRAVIAINAVVAGYDKYYGATLACTVLLYALQLYADFSGGIDISRGIAQIFGIDLAENFRRPYFSKSISEYWRRWHITLGAWMKEYVFYPLSLSKGFLSVSKKIKNTRFGRTKAGSHIAKVLPTAVASLIVFLIVGIWHGASWKFVAFGLWNGGVIMVSILMKPLFDRTLKKLHIKPKNVFWKAFQILRTFIIICIGYVFDIAPSFKQAIHTFVLMITNLNIKAGVLQVYDLGLDIYDFAILVLGVLIILVISVIQEKKGSIRRILDSKRFVFRWAALVVIILLISILGVYGPGYNPADFVYMQY